jgi:serine protease inhibitor
MTLCSKVVSFLVCAVMSACGTARTAEPNAPAPERAVERIEPADAASSALRMPATPDAGVVEPLEEPPADLLPATLADAVNLFARDLHAQLRKKDKGNLFYSPLSISIALTMTYAGARGETATQMAKVLHLGDGTDAHREYAALIRKLISEPKAGAPEVRLANRLWADRSAELVPAFVSLTKQSYSAPVERLDFVRQPEPSRKTINHWVEQQTHERIRDLLPAGSITDATRLVLTNAIYFKGRWATPFPKEKTRDQRFYANGTTPQSAPTMHLELTARYAELPDAQVLELPYSSGKGPLLAMLVVLPKARNGLDGVERAYARDGIAAFTQKLATQRVDVHLPRFTATTSLELAPVLRALGMPVAFSGAADFSGMFTDAKPNVDAVYHRAFVETNEGGTEAAAATGVVLETGAIVSSSGSVFRADHPFIFVIREVRSGVVVFAGRVAHAAD